MSLVCVALPDDPGVHDWRRHLLSQVALKSVPLTAVVSFQAVIIDHVQITASSVWHVVECRCLLVRLSPVHSGIIALLPAVGLAPEVHALLVESSVVEQDIAVSAIAVAWIIDPDWV